MNRDYHLIKVAKNSTQINKLKELSYRKKQIPFEIWEAGNKEAVKLRITTKIKKHQSLHKIK